MTRAKPRKPETVFRYLRTSINIAQQWNALSGDHINETNACLNRCRALIAELRRALKEPAAKPKGRR